MKLQIFHPRESIQHENFIDFPLVMDDTPRTCNRFASSPPPVSSRKWRGDVLRDRNPYEEAALTLPVRRVVFCSFTFLFPNGWHADIDRFVLIPPSWSNGTFSQRKKENSCTQSTIADRNGLIWFTSKHWAVSDLKGSRPLEGFAWASLLSHCAKTMVFGTRANRLEAFRTLRNGGEKKPSEEEHPE